MKEKEKKWWKKQTKKILLYLNMNAWIENKKWRLFQWLQTYDWIFFPGVSSRPIFFGREIKNEFSKPLLVLLIHFKIATTRFCEFVTSLGAHRFARIYVMYTSIGWHLIFFPVIGGGDLVHPGAHTQHVRHGLTVYTSLCTQPSSSSCDWLTRFSYIACP